MAKLKHRSGKLIHTAGGKLARECLEYHYAVIEFSSLVSCGGALCLAALHAETYVVPVTPNGSGGYYAHAYDKFFPSPCGTFYDRTRIWIEIGPTSLVSLEAYIFGAGAGGLWVFIKGSTGCSPSPCTSGMQTFNNGITACGAGLTGPLSGETLLPVTRNGVAEVTLIP